MLESSFYLPQYRSVQLAALTNGAVYDQVKGQKRSVKHEKNVVKNPIFPFLVAVAVLLIAHLRNAFLAKKTVAFKKQISKVTHKVIPPKPFTTPLISAIEPKKAIAIVTPQIIELKNPVSLPIEIKPLEPKVVTLSAPVIEPEKAITSPVVKAFESEKPVVTPVLEKTQLISPIVAPVIKSAEPKEATVIISPPVIASSKPLLASFIKSGEPQKPLVEAVPVIEIKSLKPQVVTVSPLVIEPKKEVTNPAAKAFEPKPIIVPSERTKPINPIVVPILKSTELKEPTVIISPPVMASPKPLPASFIKSAESQKPLTKAVPVLKTQHPAQSVVTASPVVLKLKTDLSTPIVKVREPRKPSTQSVPKTAQAIMPVASTIPKIMESKESIIITTAPVMTPKKLVAPSTLKATKPEKPIVKALPAVASVPAKPNVKSAEPKKQVVLPTPTTTAPVFAIRPIYTMNVAYTENGETQVSYSALPLMSVVQ